MTGEPAPPKLSAELESRVLLWGALALVAFIAVYLGYVYSESGVGGLGQLATLGGLSLVAAGKLVIFFGLDPGQPPIWSLALLTFLIDLVFAFALASGLRGLERAPLVGGWLVKSRTRAKQVLVDYPGLRRWAFFGAVAFVLLPIAGTGAITGSIVARLLGLSRLAGIGAVALASAWSACAFALLAYYVGDQAEAMLKNPVLVAGVLVGAAIVGWIAYKRVIRELRRKG